MDTERKTDPAKWTIRQLFNALTVGQILALLSGLVVIVGGAFSFGIAVEKNQAPFLPTITEKESLVDAEFMISRKRAYETAISMVEEVAKARNTTESILNIRSGRTVPEEERLYARIIEEAKKGDILYTRAATYESDPDLEVTRRFLEELGEKKNIRVIVTAGNTAVPSCFITDAKALLGFKADDGTINHGLYIRGPEQLVQDVRTMYQKILNDKGYAHTIKDYGNVIPKDKVDSVISSLKSELEKRRIN